MDIIRKYRIFFFIILIFIYIFAVPIGFNSINELSSSISDGLIESDDVLSFTSLKSDIILLIDGDDNIISQEVYDWVANFSNTLELNQLVHFSISKHSSVQHIFERNQKILSPYLSNLFTAIALANVTLYTLIEGSREYINEYLLVSDQPDANLIAADNAYNKISNDLSLMAMGLFIKQFARQWMDTLSDFFVDNDYNYSSLIDNWNNNIDLWLKDYIDSSLYDYLKYFLNNIDEGSELTEEFFYPRISTLLFGYQNDESINYLISIFAGGDAKNAIREANDNLLDFIKGDYSPLGFPEEIRQFYQRSFTNSAGNDYPTAIMVKLTLRSDLNQTGIKNILRYFNEFAENLNNNEFNYEVVFLSQLNYLDERSESIANEFHKVDVITLILGFFILFFFFRDIKYSSLVLSIAYLTTQVSKALVIKTLPYFIDIEEAGFSIAITIILGATMNYTVFFVHRFREELVNGREVALEKASSTALHSIRISGMAIILTFIPLSFSSLVLIKNIAAITLMGISFNVILLNILLPTVFLFLKNITSPKKYSKKSKHKFKIPVHFSNAKKYILISLMIFIISSSIILFSGSSVAVNDFVGSSGSTGRAMRIVENKFPENYFSTILVEFNLSSEISFDPGKSTDKLAKIDLLSQSINNTNDVSSLLSISWPLGIPFNYDNTSVAVISRASALTTARQLFIKDTNQTYILIQLYHSVNSQEAMKSTRKIKLLIYDFVDNSELIDEVRILGTLAQSEEDAQILFKELPLLIIIAIFILTIFLWFKFKSISVPLRLELTIIMGSIYALSISTIIWLIFTGNPINLLIILVSIIILLGLGTDFDIYIYTRIMEEYEMNNDMELAVNDGVINSSPAVMASGMVMAVSFIALLWGDIGLIRQFGLVTFFAIIIDIFFIRLFLVPAFLLYRNSKN